MVNVRFKRFVTHKNSSNHLSNSYISQKSLVLDLWALRKHIGLFAFVLNQLDSLLFQFVPKPYTDVDPTRRPLPRQHQRHEQFH